MKLADAEFRVKQEVCHPLKVVTLLEILRCIAVALCVTNGMSLVAAAESREIRITQPYLNIPINRDAKEQVFDIKINGKVEREFPSQLADRSIDYWIYLDVSEFKGKTISISGAATQSALNHIYESRKINGANNLYREPNRPQFHFTADRGWSNDVNGPIFYKGQYHVFWQSYPFGTIWDTGFMYWGHATSKDLIHWQQLTPALMVDKLGSPWSGTSLIDSRNDGGWGKGALVLVYANFDRFTHKQVQCIAYSNDGGVTFKHFAGNPIVDSNQAVGSNDTRDPKVFWYEPTKHWVMVLFELDGMSFYTSTNLKTWSKQSHFKGLFECPDFFELPVESDAKNKKWILHGGSASYFIGTFDGNSFKPESSELRYAEGKNEKDADILYAAQSFAEMPDNRRVQIAWARTTKKQIPFDQMMLFPTEFRLSTTKDGLRLLATPIHEIAQLHTGASNWSSLTAGEATEKLDHLAQGPIHIKMTFTLADADKMLISYRGHSLATIQAKDFPPGEISGEILVDRGITEIFLDEGIRYIVKELPNDANGHGLAFSTEASGSKINELTVYAMDSMWQLHPPDPKNRR
jgi:fructan beta-fructosidase